MNDGAAHYRSKVARLAQRKMRIESIPWPPESPDLNPTENLWRMMKSRINKREHLIGTKEDLKTPLVQNWDQCTAADFNMLIENVQKGSRSVSRTVAGLCIIDLG